jgi:hypothetical protein
MLFFCVYTPSHEILYRDYFRPSLEPSLKPGKVELLAIELKQEGGHLGTDGYYAGLRKKLDLLLECLRAHPGEIIVSTDVDIVYVRPAADDLEKWLTESDKDILFQREGKRLHYFNGGLYVCHSCEGVIRFIQAVRDRMETEPMQDDQFIGNWMLQDGFPLRYGFLPLACYARTHGWPPPKNIAIYHANETLGKHYIASKLKQFRDLALIRKYGWVGVLWTSIPKIPKRLIRWLGLKK